MESAVLFGSFLVMLFIGVPIGFAIGLSVLFTMASVTNMKLILVAHQSLNAVDSFPLMAIPFFMLAGNIMSTGGVAKRLVDLANALFGFMVGGLAVVGTATSMFFGAISGSAVATTSAVGSFLIPEMKKQNYDVAFSAASVAAAGTVGVIIPPSIPLVIYAVVVGGSVVDLFIAGIIPGILMGLSLIIANILMCKKMNIKCTNGPAPSLKEVGRTFWAAIPALLAPVIILGGIYSGYFTPTEAAVVAVIYSALVGSFIYKELTWKSLYRALYDSIIVNGVTTFMVGLSGAFAIFLTMQHIPTDLARMMLELTDNKFLILLMINVFLLIVGMFVDNIPATIILSPIFLPVVADLGIGPTQLGLIITMNLAIGFITPPYGINLFVASAVAGVPVEKMARPSMWMIVALLVVLALVTYVPQTTMFLVDLMKAR